MAGDVEMDDMGGSSNSKPSKMASAKANLSRQSQRYCGPCHRFGERFKQQKLSAWQPILTPLPVIIVFTIIGVAMVIIGCIFIGFTFSVNESKTYRYDNLCPLRGKCVFRFELEDDFHKPFLYYRYENFYQNHRRYLKSVSFSQLRGDDVNDYDELEGDCTPATSLNDDDSKSSVFLPCGLRAVSYASHDSFKLQYDNGQDVYVDDDVAWPTDKVLYDDPGSDTKGVRTVGNFENQQWMVWNRVAALSNFLKLWQRVRTDLDAGIYRMVITNNMPVAKFDGKKFFRLSEVTWLGGRNVFTGFAFLVVGIILLVLAAIFLAKQILRPRKLGDTQYLEWNERKN